MVNHTPFIVGAYIVALVGFGGLVIASLMARRRIKRELSARGLSGERARR